MTKEQLHQKALKLPKLPGVYIIKDKAGVIIYIGKAKVLFTRVGQYFRAGVPHAFDGNLGKHHHRIDIKNGFPAAWARGIKLLYKNLFYHVLVLKVH